MSWVKVSFNKTYKLCCNENRNMLPEVMLSIIDISRSLQEIHRYVFRVSMTSNEGLQKCNNEIFP